MRKETFLALVFGVISTGAHAQAVATPISPEYNSTGNYSVSREPCSVSEICYIQERYNSGSWITLANSSVSTIVQVSGRAPGEYFYRAVKIVEEGFSFEPIPTWYYSQQSRTIVDAVPQVTADSFAEQLQYEFEIRTGDFDGNGYTDVLVDRLTPGPVDGSLQSTVIWNTGTGVTAAIPTNSQLDQARSHPINPDISFGGEDGNFDGYADVVLEGLQLLASPGHEIDALILYANGVAGGAQPTATLMDEEFLQFFADFSASYTDPIYFTSREQIAWRPVFSLIAFCPQRIYWGVDGTYFGISDNRLLTCTYEPVLVDIVPQLVGIGYDPRARQASDAFKAITSDQELTYDAWRTLSDAMKQVTGVDSFGFLASGASVRPNLGEDVNNPAEESIRQQSRMVAMIQEFVRWKTENTDVPPEEWERHVYDVEPPGIGPPTGTGVKICSTTSDTTFTSAESVRGNGAYVEQKTIPASVCTQENVFCWLRRNPAPRQNGSTATINDQEISDLDGGNPIRTYVFPTTRTIVNQTLPGHLLDDPLQTEFCGDSDRIDVLNSRVGTDGVTVGRCSYVHRQVTQFGNDIHVTTHGEGHNAPRTVEINELGGKDIFWESTQWIKERMAREGICSDD